MRSAPLPCRAHRAWLSCKTHASRCVRQRTTARAAGESQVAGQSAQRARAPWSLTFDLRERDTEWSEANKARLVAIVTARELGLSTEEVSSALESLMLVLPDLCVAAMRPALLARLVSDLPHLPQRLMRLKALLPCADVSRAVAGRPQLLLQPMDQLRATAGALQALMGQAAAARLVEEQPVALEPGCVDAALAEMRRLLPAQTDVVAMLAADPSWLLRAQAGVQWLGAHPDSDNEAIDLMH